MNKEDFDKAAKAATEIGDAIARLADILPIGSKDNTHILIAITKLTAAYGGFADVFSEIRCQSRLRNNKNV